MTLPIRLSDRSLAIGTSALVKRYRQHRALQGLDLDVPTGAVYLLVGPNGAGKSTTMKILMGLLEPTSGTAHVLGLDTGAEGALVRANVGYVPETPAWGHGWMHVARLLHHHAAYFPAWDLPYAQRLINFFGLPVRQRVKTLSKGQSRRLHLVMALAHRPPVLILDEPLDGLDPVMRDQTLRALVAHLADTPTTVLLSTHHVGEVERLADHIGVLRSGQLCVQSGTEQLAARLRRYRGVVPPGWTDTSGLNGGVVRRTTTRDEIDWIVWGDENEVTQRLAHSGAAIRSVDRLSLEEATIALLTPAGDTQ